MQKTGIEWVRNPVMKSPDLDPTQASSYELGWTFNPITGCLNNCSYCYARKLANGRLKHLYLANQTIVSPERIPRYYAAQDDSSCPLDDPFYPRFWEDRFWQPRFLRGRGGIFVCDMSDLFGIDIPWEWTERVLWMCRTIKWHRYYLLTKQPQNLSRFSPFPGNCWVGATVTDRKMYLEATGADGLDGIEARVKYISFEPLLEAIQPNEYRLKGISWVIIGAMTGTKSDLMELNKKYPDLTLTPYGKKWTLQPKETWVFEIIEVCRRTGIPCFLKNNLKPLLSENLVQEMPVEPCLKLRREVCVLGR